MPRFSKSEQVSACVGNTEVRQVFLAGGDSVGTFSSGKLSGQQDPFNPACRGVVTLIAWRSLVDPV